MRVLALQSGLLSGKLIKMHQAIFRKSYNDLFYFEKNVGSISSDLDEMLLKWTQNLIKSRISISVKAKRSCIYDR